MSKLFVCFSEHDMKLYTKLEGLPSYMYSLTVIAIDTTERKPREIAHVKKLKKSVNREETFSMQAA
jgi:hypothetical protein